MVTIVNAMHIVYLKLAKRIDLKHSHTQNSDNVRLHEVIG